VNVITRILAVIVAYALACTAASAVFTIGMLTPQWDDWSSLGLPPAALSAVIAVGAAIIGAVAILPALLVIVLAEGFAWRSSLVYAALGGAVALALGYGLDLGGYIGEVGGGFDHEREVFAAAGIAGGLVYWLVAGRKAGIWKPSRTA
jgi:hypothetical protein